MVTLSTCSYKFPANWEKVFFFVFFFFCDVMGIFPIETVVLERFLCLDFDALSASVFLSTLNEIHPSFISTMELSDVDYVGFTSRHFHESVEEHKRPRKRRARKGSRDHRKKFQDCEEMSGQTGLSDL